MKIEYNGVELALVEIHSYERQNIFSADHCDLLYVRHKVNLTAQVVSGGNPHGLAAKTLRQGDTRIVDGVREAGEFLGEAKASLLNENVTALNTTANPDAGEFFAATDKLLVPTLLTPRRKLKMTAYRRDAAGNPQAFVFLESPRPGLLVDSLNGPHPLGCTTTEMTGEAPVSGVLNFQIETHLPPVDNDASRPIISHRWVTTIGHDEDYYATRQITGEAVFDTGLMQRFSESHDAFISQLYHPIPLGFRRNLPSVELSSDGSHLTYTITDTAVSCVFDAADSGATQMMIAENWKFTSPKGMGYWSVGENGSDGGGGRNWFQRRVDANPWMKDLMGPGMPAS